MDSCLENVSTPLEMKKWISQWIRIIGCSDRVKSKYGDETPAHKNETLLQNDACPIEHSMHVLYERYVHPSPVGVDDSLVGDINQVLRLKCSCNHVTHLGVTSVLFFIKRRIEKKQCVKEWIDYILKNPEKVAIRMAKKRDYFRSDETHIKEEVDWFEAIHFAIPFIVPIMTLSEICTLHKRLFSRIRKIDCSFGIST